MRASGPSLRLDRARMAQGLALFRSKVAPTAAVDAVRDMTVTATREIVQTITGAGAVETGRYRGAWAVGALQATGEAVGPFGAASVLDGSGTLQVQGTAATATVQNHVPYAPEVEYGTADRAAGLHMTKALRVAARDAEGVTLRALAKAWGD